MIIVIIEIMTISVVFFYEIDKLNVLEDQEY